MGRHKPVAADTNRGIYVTALQIAAPEEKKKKQTGTSIRWMGGSRTPMEQKIKEKERTYKQKEERKNRKKDIPGAADPARSSSNSSSSITTTIW